MNELSKNLHIAKVINNNNSDENGKVTIYIPYMHKGIKNSLLPEALPFTYFLGGSSSFGVSNIPEKNSYIWVFFEDDILNHNPFYIGNVNNEDTNPHKLFKNEIRSKIGSSGNYPDVKFIYAPNGICIGIVTTSSTPEVFIYHPKNSHIFIDSNGNIEIKSGSGVLESMVLGETLKEWLELHTHGTGVGPSTPPVEAATLITILSPKIKNN